MGGSVYVSPIDEQRIRRAVDGQLSARGYRKVGSAAEADLVVSFTIGSQQKTRAQQTGGSMTSYYPDYAGGQWYGTSPVRVYTYTGGTLSLEFYDRRSKQAVWVGWAAKPWYWGFPSPALWCSGRESRCRRWAGRCVAEA